MRVPGVLLALPTLFSLAAAACTVGNEAAANAPPGGGGGPAGVPVTIASVVTKSMPVELRVIGTAEASSSVAIRAQVNGELTKYTSPRETTSRRGRFCLPSTAGRTRRPCGRPRPTSSATSLRPRTPARRRSA